MGGKDNVIIVKSLKEACDYISSNDSFKKGMMSFRGQSQRYYASRLFPNPIMDRIGEQNGKEELILPGLWRGNSDVLRTIDPGHSLFDSIFANDLIFKGINVSKMHKENFEKYGIHTNSDLEDFNDEESNEYYKRWKDIIVSPYYKQTLTALEQHYGLQTLGLDVTFDLGVAFFFATHQFVKKSNGKATFVPKDDFKESVVYCFRFSSPAVYKTNWLIDKIDIFSHIPPIRPLRQTCALPFFHFTEINAAAANISIKIALDKNFDMTGIPEARNLFPDSDEDLFYKELLRMKKKSPEFFADIVEYEF